MSEASENQVDMILMPRALTAENGAKAALIGEFSVTYEHINPLYCGCEVCHECLAGSGCTESVTGEIVVPWTTIKAIYKKCVELFGEEDAASGVL